MQESRAYGMLSGSIISHIKDRLAEMEAKYARSAKCEARRKYYMYRKVRNFIFL